MKLSENHQLILAFLIGEKTCLNAADCPSGISVLFSREQEDRVHMWQILKSDFDCSVTEEFLPQK